MQKQVSVDSQTDIFLVTASICLSIIQIWSQKLNTILVGKWTISVLVFHILQEKSIVQDANWSSVVSDFLLHRLLNLVKFCNAWVLWKRFIMHRSENLWWVTRALALLLCENGISYRGFQLRLRKPGIKRIQVIGNFIRIILRRVISRHLWRIDIK